MGLHGHCSAPLVWALPHAVACGCTRSVHAAGCRQEKPLAQVFRQRDFNSRNRLPGCWEGEGSRWGLQEGKVGDSRGQGLLSARSLC